jgi:transposase-like protein
MHRDQKMPRAKTSKSAKIREALTATPDKAVVEIAKEFGVKPGLVYNVKANMKKKAGKAKGKPGRKPGKKPATKEMVSHAAHDALGAAVDFVIKVGGLRHAEKLLGTLKAIKDQL